MQAQEPISVPATHAASKRRAAIVVVASYLAVWAGLVALLLSRPENVGEFGDPRAIGILFVSFSLGVALLISLLWLVGWRFCALVVGIGIVLVAVPRITSDAGFSLVASGLGIALAYAAVAGNRTAPAAAPATSAAGPTSILPLVLFPLIALFAMGFFWFSEAMRVGLS